MFHRARYAEHPARDVHAVDAVLHAAAANLIELAPVRRRHLQLEDVRTALGADEQVGVDVDVLGLDVEQVVGLLLRARGQLRRRVRVAAQGAAREGGSRRLAIHAYHSGKSQCSSGKVPPQ